MSQSRLPARASAFVAVVAGATAVAALPAAAGAAQPAQRPASKPKTVTMLKLLTVSSLRTGTRAAPVAITVRRLERDTKLRAWVNGRPADDAFEAGARGQRHGTLSVQHGLRHGRNVIRLRADRADGHRDVERRVVRLARSTPLANAGPDILTTAGDVTVGPQRKGLAGDGGELRSSWSIVEAPAGSDADLQDPDATRPTLADADDGTYVLRHTVTDDDGDVSHDTVTVAERPDDPPIGVSLRTVRPGDAYITIGADTVVSAQGMKYAVLERATRKVVRSGAVTPDKAGADQLKAVCDSYAKTDDYMMIVSQWVGRAPDTVPVLDDLLTCLGGARLTNAERTSLYGGQPFTFIGLPGAARGAAWTKIRETADSPRDPDMDAWLQFNDATQQYDVVDLRRPTYDTAVPGRPAGTNTMRINGAELTRSLPSGATAGFHVVAVDDRLAVTYNEALATNGAAPTTDAQRQTDLLAKLESVTDSPLKPTVFIQSIGRVKAASGTWNDVADQIVRLGGAKWTFNELQGTDQSSYALIGRVDHDLDAAEVSPLVGDDAARLVGGLSRTRRGYFEPLVESTGGTIGTGLTDLVNQAPEAFPAVNAAAMTYLAKRLNFCEGAATCDLRYLYWKRYRAEWLGKKSTLENTDYPGDGRGFTEPEFRATKAQLVAELIALTDVQKYFTTLKSPFAKAQSATRLDLQALTDDMKSQLNPGNGAMTAGQSLKLLSFIVKIGVITGPPTSYGFDGASGALALASFLSDEYGRPSLATQFQSRSDALGRQLADSFDRAQASLDTIALVIVSDWGKLRTAGVKVDNEWALPALDGATLIEMRRGVRAMAAKTLLPAAYPTLSVVRPPVGDANGLECAVRVKGNPYEHTFSRMAHNVQRGAAVWINADGSPLRKGAFMAWNKDTWPSEAVGNLLFNPIRARTNPGLQLSIVDLMQPQNFPDPVKEGVDRGSFCALSIPLWRR